MGLHNIPLLMVLAFLFVTLITGLCFSKKATNFRPYAVGTKQFHIASLMATLLTTIFGGGLLMREVPYMYNKGILWILTMIPFSTISVYIINLLSLHMGPFMHHLSIAETIGSLYGKHLRMVTALLGTGCCVGIVSIQINVMSSAIAMCMDMDSAIVTILSTLTLISYAAFGGIRAITITDLFQLLIYTIFIPFLIKFLFSKTDQSFLEIVDFLKKQEFFQCKPLFQFDKKVLSNLSYGLSVIFALSPSMLQRFYMCASPIQAKKVFLRVIPFVFMIWVGICLIGLFVFVANPTLEKEAVWRYILTDMSPVYKTYVAIAILAMTMSCADSALQTASIMVSHDIVESMGSVEGPPYPHKLGLAKLVTFITGLLAMFLTIYHPDLFVLTKFVGQWLFSCFSITVIPLFILTVFGFRGTTGTVLIGIVTGMLVLLVWNHWVKPTTGLNGNFIVSLWEKNPALAVRRLNIFSL